MEFTKLELLGGLGVLVSVIALLWLMLQNSMTRDNERLAKYELHSEEHMKKVIELTGEHRELKGRIDTIEKVSVRLDGIERLSSSVLDEVRKR